MAQDGMTAEQKAEYNDGHIAISHSEYKRHGCPYCNYRYGSSFMSGGGCAPVRCDECDNSFTVVADNLDRAGIGCGRAGRESVYPWVLPHPRADRTAWVHRDPGPNEDGSENFRSRGVGYDSGACCFVTGRELPLGGSNISGYVDFKESGERVVAMFGETGGAWLDYRDHAPTYIQAKVLCCEEHVRCLEKLHELTVEAGGRISPEMIELARSAKGE